MALNSYKQWRVLNETFGGFGPITLGLGKQQSVGVVGAQLGEEPEGEELDEKKKCCGKKMDAEVELKAKPDAEAPPEDDDETSEVPEDDGKLSDEDSDDDDDDGDDDDDEGGDDDDEGGDSEVPDEGDDADPDITKKPLLMKKKMKKGMKKAMKKGMKKEDQDWWNSVNSMMLADPNYKSWDGFTRIEEDALLPPADANAGLGDMEPRVDGEPQPGEPGFAPQSRIGS